MNDIRILSLEAYEIYSNDIKDINKKYKSILTNSLDLIYLKKSYKKDFIVETRNEFDYTKDIINVSFSRTGATKLSTKELRKEIYKGFTLQFEDSKIEYVRYKRSSGLSREGKCLFIKKSLYDSMNKWTLCGLDENSDLIKNDLVSFEAYKALSLSGIIATIEINPKNILLIDDFEYEFKDLCINVKKQNNDVIAEEEKTSIKNNIWDGEGLLDESLFQGHYKHQGMLYLRNRFFKSCVFNTKLQEFFKANNIKDINQLNGRTLATKVEDIKMVITTSSLKYLKFSSFEEWVKNVDSTFGIIKFDKPTHYFNGNMVSTNYQLINTLNFKEEDIKDLIADEEDYLTKLKNDPDIVRFHLESNVNHNKKMSESNVSLLAIKSILTSVFFKINKDFINTKLYSDYVADLVESYLSKMKKGNLLVNGTYAYLFGNGYELLLETIKKFDRNNPESLIKPGEVMTTFFKNGEELTCERNPHITMGNILIGNNKHYEEYKKWFNLTRQIICINAIDENIQQRLNGCDYDSDSVLVTNNKYINEKARLHYVKFKVPTCGLEVTKIEESDLSVIDYNIQNNKIGDIVNLSQWLNSILWEKINNNEDYTVIYKEIAKLAVLSGAEIDKAKRDYGINVSSIINEIKARIPAEYKQRPMILLNEDKPENYRYYNTSIDNLSKALNGISIKKTSRGSNKIDLLDLICETEKASKQHYDNKNAVIEILKNTQNEINKLNKIMKINDLDDSNTKLVKDDISRIYAKAEKEIGGKLQSPQTIKLILKELSSKKNYALYWYLLYFLKQKEEENFNACFKNSETKYEALSKLVESKNGDINIFGKRYIKKQPTAVIIEDPNGDQFLFGKRIRVEYKLD